MIILYRLYQIFIWAPLIVVITIITALVTLLLSFIGLGRWGGYRPAQLWSRLFCWLTFVGVSVKGHNEIEKGKSYLFVANHQGAYDIFSIYGWLGHNFRWMMKQSLRKIPFVGFACAAAGQIFVDNSSVKGVKRTIRDAEKRLSGGMSLVVFPEGSRTLDGKLHRFKKGAFKLAVEFGLPVVPITIEGSYDVMPRRAYLPRPGHISLTIHEPIAVDCTADPDAEIHRLMKASREVIAKSLGEE